MSEAPEDAPQLAQLAPNPADAQATVNDFLDYTDFFPSDLSRSLTLISDLDAIYDEAVQEVHRLTTLYGSLPSLPEAERPDPTQLRKQIAQQLQRAINQREYASTEASRLYEVAVRHCQRTTVIKKKLQAQPEPPSRDPTPPPVSPQAHRTYNRNYERPAHERLAFDAAHARKRERHKKFRVGTGTSDSSDDDGWAVQPIRKQKQHKDRPPKSRSRAPGVLGTNVHSAKAGISTSNALAKLARARPPPDAKRGSKWLPWMKLTEYEMALLRKKMKKNAIWKPSETMVNRELEKEHRTRADYEAEKARCEATGDEFLDEEPETPEELLEAAEAAEATHVEVPEPIEEEETPEEEAEAPEEIEVTVPPVESSRESTVEDMDVETETVSIRIKPTEESETVQDDRLSQREKAMQDLFEATEKIQAAAKGLKGLSLVFGSEAGTSPSSQQRKTNSKTSNKRKREDSLPSANGDALEVSAEPSGPSKVSEAGSPEPKRLRIEPPAVLPTSITTSIVPPPVLPTEEEESSSSEEEDAEGDADTEVDVGIDADGDDDDSAEVDAEGEDEEDEEDAEGESESAPASPKVVEHTSTVQVPLAPAGPGTPKPIKAPPTPLVSTAIVPPPVLKSSPKSPAAIRIPVVTKPTPVQVPLPSTASKPAIPSPQVQTPTSTAASSRPRRSSVAPKAETPPLPNIRPKSSPTAVAAPEATASKSSLPTRPRSARSHVPTPKAQSEEPNPKLTGRPARETRRHSIFGQSTLPAAPTPLRASSRRKPPPKGEVSVTESGQKTVTSSKRTKSKKKTTKKGEENIEPTEEEEVDEIDPDEPRYCICNGISEGTMISCDNNCDTEWFHLECVNMTPDDLPARRAKWYCPNCRKLLGVDANGKPNVAPALPGRRGNR